MAIEAGGMRRRVERLKELTAGFEKEWSQVSRQHGPLNWAEHQAYIKGVREAADGLERAHLVLADALARVERGPASRPSHREAHRMAAGRARRRIRLGTRCTAGVGRETGGRG